MCDQEKLRRARALTPEREKQSNERVNWKRRQTWDRASGVPVTVLPLITNCFNVLLTPS